MVIQLCIVLECVLCSNNEVLGVSRICTVQVFQSVIVLCLPLVAATLVLYLKTAAGLSVV